MLILTSLETETTTESNDATEEPVEADFWGTSKSHKRDMMSSKLSKRDVFQTPKFLKTKKKVKLLIKTN